MANPQPDKFTKISNELMEALSRIGIPQQPRRCLDYLFRMTYGWNRKHATLRNQDFVAATGLSKNNVCKAIKILKDMNLVVTQRGNNGATTYCIQKDYSKWVTQRGNRPVTQRGNSQLPVEVTPVTQRGNSQPPQPSHTNGSSDPKESIKESSLKTTTIRQIPPAKTLVDIWNSNVSRLPKVQVLTDQRRSKCNSRLKHHASCDKEIENFIYNFTLAVKTCEQNSFLNGSEKGWKATFDWLINNNTNYVKVCEGQYDRQVR